MYRYLKNFQWSRFIYKKKICINFVQSPLVFNEWIPFLSSRRCYLATSRVDPEADYFLGRLYAGVYAKVRPASVAVFAC